MTARFTRSFTKQAELPLEALVAAQNVLRSAALHRYQTPSPQASETALLEADFADWQGAQYCLAVASGGQAMQLALRACGVQSGDAVLTNAFTLAPVPGAIRATGGMPVLVETTADLLIDLDDLAQKAMASGARVLLLSHMRGHLPDMDALLRVADHANLTIIEDCAHTMGATWNGRKSGSFGAFGCFSTQSYKHMNSGEGGLLTSDDPQAMAQAIIMSGSYMNYDRHGAAPALSYFEDARYDCPNMSARMDNLRAAVLRPQIPLLDRSIEDWKTRHDTLAAALVPLADAVVLPAPINGAIRVGSSLQFRVPALTAEECAQLVLRFADHCVEVKWFGCDEPKGFTSQHRHWRYVQAQSLPRTDEILRGLFDMRVPLSFSVQDCRDLGAIMHAILSTFIKGVSS